MKHINKTIDLDLLIATGQRDVEKIEVWNIQEIPYLS